MPHDNLMMIAVTEAKHAITDETGDVETILKAAMHATKDHWMVTDDEARFRAAIAATMLHFGEGSEEFERLKWEAGQLNKIQAFIKAAEAGLNVSLPDELDEAQPKPIGLIKLWHEVKAGRSGSA